MNRKEVLEIRKQFSPENCAITRIAGCYVDGEKEKRMEREEAFLSLPEEQAFKYFDIFKKTLSGKIGKNLLNLDYKLKADRSSDPEGEEHELEKIFSSNGVPDEKMEMFEDAYRENIGNVPVMASNICDNKVVNIQVSEGKITINADFISNLEIKEVDGRKCMVLPVDYVKVNGISTKA